MNFPWSIVRIHAKLSPILNPFLLKIAKTTPNKNYEDLICLKGG